MKIREIMTRKVVTVLPTDSLELARQTMLWGGFRHVPVVEGNVLVGIVSDRDVLQAKRSAAARTRDAEVRDVMRVPVETATPDATIDATAARMAALKIGAMPVLERGRLVGLVTATDLLAHLGRSVRANAARPHGSRSLGPKPAVFDPKDAG